MVEIALLDGGLGQEINKRSPSDSHPLWSVKVMLDTPQVVVDVHSDFIAAGARVICLNTYAATPTRMAHQGLEDQFEEAHATAIRLANTAVKTSGSPAGSIQVAGCLPPLVSSYVSEVSHEHEQSIVEFRQIVRQQKGSVDLFLIETMSNIDEALAALTAVEESGKPAYIGLTISDDLSNTLRSGERLEDAVSALLKKNPDGILLNCSIPEAISKALPIVADAGVRFGAYANGFTSIDKLQPNGTVDVLEARKDLTPEAYGEFVMDWIDMGATIVGGCCEVGPAHIKYLADHIMAADYTITDLK